MSGGGFGALDSMNKSLKKNRGLVRKIRVFDKIKNYSSAQRNMKPEFTNKFSEEELEGLRAKAKRQDRIHTFVQILKMVLVLAAIVIFLALIINGGSKK